MDEEIDNTLEDGEISNDSEDDYTPLERPRNYATTLPMPKFPVPSNCSESEERESTSDSGSDSDAPVKRQKRPKLKVRPLPKRNSTNKKYNIWSTHIQEDVLAHNLNTCDVTLKDRSRDIESYDYRRTSNKRTRDDRKNSNLRLINNRSEDKNSENGVPRDLADIVVTADNTDEEVAKDLANKLYEEKEDLLLKIIEVIGKEKSLKVFTEVKRIEKDGGMLIMNQTRRRTPGGVYFFLVKHDDELTREQKIKIFEDEKQKFKNEVRIKKKLKAEKMKKEIKLSKKNLPELLTKAEVLSNLEDWRNNSKKEGDHPYVANPPPTPETDCHENSGDGIDQGNDKVIINESGRSAQSYDDDFIDLGNVNNDMDLF